MNALPGKLILVAVSSMLACDSTVVTMPFSCPASLSLVPTPKLDAFMETRAQYEPFRMPMDSKEDPLMLAAFEKG